MEAWKKKIERETKSEAAVAAAAAIKGALEESKAATKEVREALASLGPKDAGESPDQSPAGGGGLNVALEEMEQFRQELKGVNDRLGNHEDRLDDILKVPRISFPRCLCGPIAVLSKESTCALALLSKHISRLQQLTKTNPCHADAR